jgi:cytochrome c-type biogenesis protein CcsB
VAAGGGSVVEEAPAQSAEDTRGRRWGAIALVLTALGALAHGAVLVTRGLATDRLPWGNMYEFSTATVFVAVVAYLVFALRTPGLRHIGLFVLAPVVLAMVLIGLFLYAEAGPLVAALRSYWLAIHVSTAIIGFGIFFVSGIASALYLAKTRHDERVAAGEEAGGLLSRLPGAAVLDRVAHRTAVFGFPIWTFTVIAGAIWAEAAWGRFWGWDPKETWAFIAWVVYAAYLHARTTAGWRGKPAAWVNVAGLAVMIFNLTFVNMVSTGLHSYAGVN